MCDYKTRPKTARCASTEDHPVPFPSLFGEHRPTWAPFPSSDCTDAVRPLNFSVATLRIVSKQDA